MTFDPKEQAWLELSHEHEKTISKKVEEAQASVTFFREKFQAAGFFLDQDGMPVETF